MRTFVFDIETSPLICYSWGLGKQFHSIDQIIEDPRMLCWAGKFLGEKKIHFGAEWDHGRQGMLDLLHSLMDEADVYVHYNGHTFDVPWVKGEFAREGMNPPSPGLEVDLYRQSRQQFRFPSHKLQYVSTALGLPGKAETGGFGLWKDVLAGDPKAQAKFKKYNVQDVRLTEQLYDRMLPWLKLPTNLPTEDMSCPRIGCPGGTMQRRGFRRTAAGLYARFQCQTCGGWSQAPRAVQTMEARNIA